jgi:RNA polymerase sporulation-specific sigma factor
MQAAEGRMFDNNRVLIIQAQGEDKDASMAALEELVKLNHGLVKAIALRFKDRGVEFEDLMQIGNMGMLKAIRSFDLERGTSFSTYAVPLIFGEIRRHLRDEGPIKVSRYYKKLGATLINLRNIIFAEEGREARIDELAAMSGVSREDVAMALDAIQEPISLFEPVYHDGGDAVYVMDQVSDKKNIDEAWIEKISLREAMEKLSEREKLIIMLRFFKGKTQTEVADEVGISQAQVSRLEKSAISSMRKNI